jgi:uncharacterized protein (DUF1778 family)
MTRTEKFTFRVTPEERQQINQVAALMERTESDAARFLFREAERTLRQHTQHHAGQHTHDTPRAAA